MTNDRAKRDEMSATRNPESQKRALTCSPPCSLRDEFDRFRNEVTARLGDGSEEMNSIAMSIAELSTDIRDMRRSQSDRDLLLHREVSNLNQRTATMLEVTAADRHKRDLDSKTPNGKLPSISIGNVRASAPPWLFGALATLVIVLVAGAATVVGVVYFGGVPRQQTSAGK